MFVDVMLCADLKPVQSHACENVDTSLWVNACRLSLWKKPAIINVKPDYLLPLCCGLTVSLITLLPPTPHVWIRASVQEQPKLSRETSV